MESNMLQIGLFSKMNRVTPKALRHYDAIGLLKPVSIDDVSGYRYYSSSQIPRLNKIVALKQMGFSLNEIQEIIDVPENINRLLDEKEDQLSEQIDSYASMLLQIKSFRKLIKGVTLMEYSPVIKSLPKVTVASMRFKAESYDTFFNQIPKMGEEMKKQNVQLAKPEYCFNIYHDGEYKETDIDVEVCEAVVHPYTDTELVTYKEVDGIDAALCIYHKGPYKALREAYGFALSWISDNGYDIDGLSRESYIDGIWNKEHENEWLTEVQIPIKTR